MAFTHAQATAYNSSSVAGTLTLTATLTNNPAVGDIVCVGVITFNSSPTVTVKDGAGTPNNYTQAVKSSTNDTTAGTSWLFYFKANSTANKAVTVTVSTNPGGVLGLFVDDFTVSAGNVAFDKALAGSGTSVTSPTNSPSITPTTGTGQLLYSHGAFSTSASGISGSWVENNHGRGAFGEDAAWILSSNAGATTVGYTFTGTQSYDTTGMTFLASMMDEVYWQKPEQRLITDPIISVWG